MTKKTERKVSVSGKPKHSNDANRTDGKNTQQRSAATVCRLDMYKRRAKRNSKGKILGYEFQSRDKPDARIISDRRLFDNTRLIGQKELEALCDELENHLSNRYNVILKEKTLPMSLLNGHKKQKRVHLFEREPFSDAFGPTSKRKRPNLLAANYESLAKKADGSQDVFEQKHDDIAAEANEADGFRELVRHTMFEKGQSKRIWGELYKVVEMLLSRFWMQGTHKVRVTNLQDASEHVGEVLKRVKKEHLQRAYKIKDRVDDNDFLVQLCKSSGKLLKGGEPDLMTKAKMILHDWQRGKIPFFVPPPQRELPSEALVADEVEKDTLIDNNQASAIRAIANVISSSRQ